MSVSGVPEVFPRACDMVLGPPNLADSTPRSLKQPSLHHDVVELARLNSAEPFYNCGEAKQ